MAYASVAALVIFVWAAVTYNRLVSLNRRAGEAWSGISVQLKRRHDLIPNLVDVVRAYAAHERDLFAEIAALRSSGANATDGAAEGPSAGLASSEGRVDGALRRLFAVSESYPDLKADGSFLRLQQSLSDVEDHLQMARRYYNGTVRNYMILHESFPSLCIARMFSFARREYFQLENETDRAVPAVSL